MTSKALPLLATLAVLLGVALAAEIVLYPIMAQAPQNRPFTTSAASPSAESGRTADQTPIWVASILARPLFSTDRRPLPAADRSGQTASIVVPRLAGIVVTPTGRRAIFAAPHAGSPQISLSEGGRIGTYFVTRIEDVGVTLTGPDGTRQVRPSFATGPEAAANAAQMATPPRPDIGSPPPGGERPSGVDLIRNTPLQIPAAPRR